jgi:hypothetical protein
VSILDDPRYQRKPVTDTQVTVWVLEGVHLHDSGKVLGVYSTRQRAEEAQVEAARSDPPSPDAIGKRFFAYEITPFVLDAGPVDGD